MSFSSRTKTRKLIWITAALSLAIVAVVFLLRPEEEKKQAPQPEPSFEYVFPEKKEVIPRPVKVVMLPDSTRVLLQKEAKVVPVKNFSTRREVKVDGDMFFEVPGGVKPLIVRTRLLVLTVEGKGAFRVIAYSKEDGEEVQVISGNIRVRKAYKSQFSEPDTLRNNQMVMINISIDLMEKEKFDTKDLRTWRDTVKIE